MCAALELNEAKLRPGRLVGVWRATGAAHLPWAGFARQESLGWWRKKGGELVDVPAHRFAERSDRDRQLRWDFVPAGEVVRGIIDPHDGQPLLKVVTRASTPDEAARYEHDRMPLLEPPLHSAAPIAPPPKAPSSQAELF